MNQITEDFVSFEIAQLLKEKGFDGECQGYYEVPTKLSSQKNVRKQLNVLPKNWNEYNKECVVCEYISISTHQMALKWLRKVHNIILDIVFEANKGWTFYVSRLIIETLSDGSTYVVDIQHCIWSDDVQQSYYKEYEQAVEAALKYTLEKFDLI